MLKRLVLSLLALPMLALWGDVKLPALFADHGVLARSAKTPIFGKAAPGEVVTVKLADLQGKATADAAGKWRVDLDVSKLGDGPYELTIAGKNTIVLKDILIGEVWLCSGQSNMGFQLKREEQAERLIATSANPKIRLFNIRLKASLKPEEDVSAKWEVAGPTNVGNFTAVGYLFGRLVQEKIQKPVGLINNAWGGSAVEAWIPMDVLKSMEDQKAWSEKTLSDYVNFDDNCAKYIIEYDKWVNAVGRAEPMVNEPPADAKWTGGQRLENRNVKGGGIVWFRKKFKVTEKMAQKGFRMYFGQMTAPVTAYIDGVLIGKTTMKAALAGSYAAVDIPEKKLAAGEHTVLVRVWASEDMFRFLKNNSNLEGNPDFKSNWETTMTAYPELTAEQRAARPKRPAIRPAENKTPEMLYNGLIYPLLPYAISGAVWYQGCANSGRPACYPNAIRAMINQWRHDFGSEFPFYYCQLANYLAKSNDPNNAGWAQIRQGQEGALTLPKTGQAILIDIGEAGDIHPLNKLTAAERLSSVALHDAYGFTDLPFSGPRCTAKEVKDGKIHLTFGYTYGGLVAKPLPATYDVAKTRHETKPLVRNSPDSEVEGFAVCGRDGKWVWANAKIDGDTITVWSDAVKEPVKVRYAFQSNPTCNLYNKAGFPAGPFEK